MNFLQFFLLYLLIINIMAFLAYGRDKRKAVKGKWRTTEFHLIFYSVIGGGIGSIIGMKYFHHKTQKPKFKLVYLFTIIFYVIFLFLLIK